jgi:hypothetical protein
MAYTLSCTGSLPCLIATGQSSLLLSPERLPDVLLEIARRNMAGHRSIAG